MLLSSSSRLVTRFDESTQNRPLAVTAALVAILLAILACVLLFRSRTVEQAVEFVPYTASRQLHFLDPEGGGTYAASLRFTAPAPWATLQRLVLDVALNLPSLPLREARIDLQGTDCAFVSQQTKLDNGDELVLTPTRCSGEIQQGDVLQGELSMTLAGPDTVATAIEIPLNTEQSGLLNIVPADDPDNPLPAVGYVSIRPTPDSARLVDQIAAIWTLPSMRWLVPLVVCAGALLAALGGVLLGMTSFRWRRVVAIGAFSLALAMVYAVLVPPFHAPDEPDHFLSFAQVAGLPELETGAHDLARAGHFERIHFRPWQRFLPHDAEAPYPIPWEFSRESADFHVADSKMESRSALTFNFWKAIGPLFQNASAAETLLGLRLCNAVFWALACMAAMVLIEWLAPPNRRCLPLYLLLIPTLPFFAMHVSNYSHFTQALTIVSGLALALFLRGRRSDASGFLLGLSCALLLLTATSAATMLGWAMMMVLGRLLLTAGDRTLTWKSAAVYWFGLLAGFATLAFFAGSAELETLGKALVKLATSVGAPAGFAGYLGDAVPLAAILTVATACGMALELGISRLGGACRRAIDSGAVWTTRAGAAAFAVLLLISAFWVFPFLTHRAEDTNTLEYMGHAVQGLLSVFTFREPCMLLSITFWSGFGWHDTFFAHGVVSLFAGVAGLGLLGAMLSVASDPRRAIRFLCIAMGALLVSVLMVYTVSAMLGNEFPNVHGRYLIGVYLLLLSVSWAGLSPATWSSVGYPVAGFDMPPPQRMRTALETCIAWCVLVVMGFSLYRMSWGWVLPTLPLPASWLYAAFALLAPFAIWMVFRTWTHCSPAPERPTPIAAPRSGFIVLMGGVAVLTPAFAELLFGLPKSIDYSLGFYALVPSVLAVLTLLWLYRPSLSGCRKALASVAFIACAATHAGCLYFLMLRYFG